MAYLSKDLSVLAYANGFTLWHYTTVDTDTVVDGAGYFDGAVEMLRVGDMVFTNVDTDGTPVTAIFVVTGIDGATVDATKLV